MFVAPAGYLLGERLGRGYPSRAGLIATALAASVLPDLDLVWFYLVSDRQNLHHNFFFYWPLFWVAVALSLRLIAWGMGWRRLVPFIGVGWPA